MTNIELLEEVIKTYTESFRMDYTHGKVRINIGFGNAHRYEGTTLEDAMNDMKNGFCEAYLRDKQSEPTKGNNN